MVKPGLVVVLFLALSLESLSLTVKSKLPEELIYHSIQTDEEGHIAPWYSPNLGEAYDHNIRLVWNFWKNMRLCSNGVKYYMQHQVWKRNKDDKSGLGGDQLNEA